MNSDILKKYMHRIYETNILIEYMKRMYEVFIFEVFNIILNEWTNESIQNEGINEEINEWINECYEWMNECNEWLKEELEEIKTGRETDRVKDRETNIQAYRHIYRQRDKEEDT